MKNIILIIALAVGMSSCNLYKSYQRPSVQVDSLYRDYTQDTVTMANKSWRELFTDVQLQALIDKGLTQNTDLRIAHLRVTQAQASLKAAKLAYVPSLAFTPQGTLNGDFNNKATSSYQLALSANWELDVFGKLTNNKRGAQAAFMQSQAYQQAVQTQLIATIANSYYTLLMFDAQIEISKQTVKLWEENVKTMQAMMQAGMTNEAAVSQAQANSISVKSSLLSLEQQMKSVENSLSTLLGQSAQSIVRGKLANQEFPSELYAGVPIQLLSNRPDVRQAEFALAQAYYATNTARSAFYPSISLGGSAGWVSGVGEAILNPAGMIFSALGSLTQPIFNKGLNKAQLKIAKARQEEAALNFQQSLYNAGADVNDALIQWQTARQQILLNEEQILALGKVLKSTQLLMKHGTSTYLEVLTAQQGLLQAQLSQVSNRFSEIQGVINLYHSIGGGSK